MPRSRYYANPETRPHAVLDEPRCPQDRVQARTRHIARPTRKGPSYGRYAPPTSPQPSALGRGRIVRLYSDPWRLL